MKKIFTLMTLALMSIGSAWADDDISCSAYLSGTESSPTVTDCTFAYYSDEGSSGNVPAGTKVGETSYYAAKMNNDKNYYVITLNKTVNGTTYTTFKAGDVITVYLQANSNTQAYKVGKDAKTAVSASNSKGSAVYGVEYTLTAAEIEEDGTVRIYRNGANTYFAGISVAGTRTLATETYTVTFNAGSNGTCATSSLTEASPGAGVTLPTVTPNDGYKFEGWYTAAAEGTKIGVAGNTYNPTSDITLYAQYSVAIVDINRSGYNTYYLAKDDVVESGIKVLCDDITMEYGTATYNAAGEDKMISGLNANYVASVTSPSTNGWGVTFTPSTSGILSVGVVINKDKKFSITNVTSFDYANSDSESGTIESNEWTPSAKQYAIVTIAVTSGTTYTFSVSGSKMALYGFEFTPTVDITPAYDKSTYVTTSALDFSSVSGLKAYVATSAENGSVTLDEVTTVPAGTPLLLIGTAETKYTVPVAASASAPGTNLLVAGDGTTTFDGTTHDYLLADDGLFYQISSGSIAVGKAYLHCASDPKASASRSLDLNIGGGGATGIETIKVGTDDNVYYDLQGRRVLYPNKGLYIVNGKKVILK